MKVILDELNTRQYEQVLDLYHSDLNIRHLGEYNETLGGYLKIDATPKTCVDSYGRHTIRGYENVTLEVTSGKYVSLASEKNQVEEITQMKKQVGSLVTLLLLES